MNLMKQLKQSTLIAVGAALLALGACQNRPKVEPSPMWVRASAAKFVTLGRSTNYALVHRAGQDTLIVEDPVLSGKHDEINGRLTWIIPLPDSVKLDTPIEVGGAGSEAWLLEQVWRDQGHATPARGTVIVHHRDADTLSASLHLTALGAAPTAGQPDRATIEIDRKFDFARREVSTPQYREMGPRAGVRQ